MHINDVACLGAVRDTCLWVTMPLGLHRPPALNEHGCNGASEVEITLEGCSAYLLFVSPKFCGSYNINMPARWCSSIVHCKGFASGITMIMLTGAPGAPGGPKIAPPLWKDILMLQVCLYIYLTIRVKHIVSTSIDFSLLPIWLKMTLSLSYSHFKSPYLQLVQTAHPVALHIGYTLKHNQQ